MCGQGRHTSSSCRVQLAPTSTCSCAPGSARSVNLPGPRRRKTLSWPQVEEMDDLAARRLLPQSNPCALRWSMICETVRPAGPAALSTAKMACFKEPSSSRASDSSKASSAALTTMGGAACVVDVAAALTSTEVDVGTAVASWACCPVPVEPLGCTSRWSSRAGSRGAGDWLLAVARPGPGGGVPARTADIFCHV